MKNILPVVLLLVLSGVSALAKNDHNNGNSQNNNGNGQGEGRTRGAPGPLMGASLPVILIGGGIYWLIRRNRAKAQTDRPARP